MTDESPTSEPQAPTDAPSELAPPDASPFPLPPLDEAERGGIPPTVETRDG